MELASQDEWLAFKYGGADFEVEVIEANDLLVEVERLHRDDALECPQCGLSVGFQAIHGDGQTAAKCNCTPKGTAFVLSSTLLRHLAERMKKQFGLPRVSLNAAREFRGVVLTKMEEAKKKRMTPPESATGTESTPEVSVS